MAESGEVAPIVEAVTHYIAGRLVERERSLAAQSQPGTAGWRDIKAERRQWRWNAVKAFFFGLIIGVLVLFAFAWMLTSSP
jgi:hypothetical protein